MFSRQDTTDASRRPRAAAMRTAAGGVRPAARAGLASTIVSVLLVTLGGCASANPAGLVPADVVRQLLAGTDHGLHVRRWQVRNEPSIIADAVSRYAEASDAADPATLARFERNGLRLVRLELASVEPLLEDLGGATLDVDGWHGQAIEWREVVSSAVDERGDVIAVDGRLTRFYGGRFHLLMRAWTMPMEEGPFLYVQLLPEHDRTQRTRLDQMLGRRPFQGDRFPTFELLLESGYAYLLTCATPDDAWDVPGPDGPDAAPPAGAVPRPASRTAMIGPEVTPPPTLGEALLRPEEEPPRREMLLFIPRIPPELQPPGRTDVTAGGAADRRG